MASTTMELSVTKGKHSVTMGNACQHHFPAVSLSSISWERNPSQEVGGWPGKLAATITLQLSTIKNIQPDHIIQLILASFGNQLNSHNLYFGNGNLDLY